MLAGRPWLPSWRMVHALIATVLCFVALRILKIIYGFIRANNLCRQLPGPQPAHWLLGMKSLVSSPNTAHTQLLSWAKKYGDIYRFRVLHKQIVVVSSPGKITKLLSHDLRLDKPSTYKTINEFASAKGEYNLLSLRTSDPMWKLVRKSVAVAFASKHIRHGLDASVLYSNQLVSILLGKEAQGPVRMDQLLTMTALDVIAKFGFHVDLGALKGECSLVPGMNILQDFFDGNAEANARVYDSFRRYRCWDKSVQHGQAVFRRLHRLNHALLAAYRSKIAAGEVSKDDITIASTLLGLRHPHTGLPLDDEVLASHVGALFWAGHDTTSNTICYVLYLLSQHPRAEAQLVAELQDAGLMEGRGTVSLSLHHLSSLAYLQAVVKESMRLLPTAGQIARYAENDIMLDGHLIPAGTQVKASILAMNRMYFKDGDNFCPERWLEDPKLHLYIPGIEKTIPDADKKSENAASMSSVLATDLVEDRADMKVKGKILREGLTIGCRGGRLVKRFIPFADGPRDCVGQNLASVVVPTTLICLLANFHFDLAPGFDHGSLCNNALIMRPEYGVQMIPVPRSA